MFYKNQYIGLECITAWEDKKNALYYDLDKKKWVHREEYTGYSYPAIFPCRSYKAAIRHLKKHNEIPVGTKFQLISWIVGQDRYLIKR